MIASNSLRRTERSRAVGVHRLFRRIADFPKLFDKVRLDTVDPNEAHFFPLETSNLFKIFFAPADYFSKVKYPAIWRRRRKGQGRGWTLDCNKDSGSQLCYLSKMFKATTVVHLLTIVTRNASTRLLKFIITWGRITPSVNGDRTPFLISIVRVGNRRSRF